MKRYVVAVLLFLASCGAAPQAFLVIGQSNSVVASEFSFKNEEFFNVNQPDEFFPFVNGEWETSGFTSQLSGFLLENLGGFNAVSAGIPGTSIKCWQKGEKCWRQNIEAIPDQEFSFIVWWQGEEDAGANGHFNEDFKEDTEQFFTDLRERFGDITIFEVQLGKLNPAYNFIIGWQYIRTAQALVAVETPGVYLIPTEDISDGEIHPDNKAEVAARIIETLRRF